MNEKSLKREIIELIICIALAIPLLVQLFFPLLPMWALFVLATIIQFYFGWSFYKTTFQALRYLQIGMNALITLGTSAAYFFSSVVFLFDLKEHTYFEAPAVIITLVLTGRLLESRASRKSSKAIEELMELQPKTARIKKNGQWKEVPIADIQMGDIFQVRPGESVPIDGEVVDGDSHINEAMLTGESAPVHKRTGDSIFGGTQNSNGSLEAKATAIGEKSALATIIRLVQEAQSSKAPVQNLADRISSFFVPLVLGISLGTWIIWWWIDTLAEAIINAVAVLVVACPCALGLAIPTAITVATGCGARVGILIRKAAAIEKTRTLKNLLIDKTGTLTTGQLKIIQKPDAEVIEIAAALESASEHPIGQIIAKEGSSKSVQNFRAISGKGVEGVVDNKRWRVGSARWMKELGLDVQAPEGETVVCIADEQKVAGYFVIGDQLRESTKKGISLLKGIGLHIVMITGDQESAAKRFASELEIDYKAEILPGDKAQVVSSFKDVGMVGDGINDAPAIAAADVGFAMRTGTDIAMESADITLMHSDIVSVFDAINLSKATFRKVWQNLFFAFIYNIVGIVLAAFGLLNPIFAGLAMAASSLCVVSNSLLLNRWRPQKD